MEPPDRSSLETPQTQALWASTERAHSGLGLLPEVNPLTAAQRIQAAVVGAFARRRAWKLMDAAKEDTRLRQQYAETPVLKTNYLDMMAKNVDSSPQMVYHPQPDGSLLLVHTGCRSFLEELEPCVARSGYERLLRPRVGAISSVNSGHHLFLKQQAAEAKLAEEQQAKLQKPRKPPEVSAVEKKVVTKASKRAHRTAIQRSIAIRRMQNIHGPKQLRCSAFSLSCVEENAELETTAPPGAPKSAHPEFDSSSSSDEDEVGTPLSQHTRHSHASGSSLPQIAQPEQEELAAAWASLPLNPSNGTAPIDAVAELVCSEPHPELHKMQPGVRGSRKSVLSWDDFKQIWDSVQVSKVPPIRKKRAPLQLGGWDSDSDATPHCAPAAMNTYRLYGANGRREYFTLLRESDKLGVAREEMGSRAGRRKHVAACSQAGLLALPVVIRGAKDGSIKLRNYGMGDGVALGMAESLEECDPLTTVDLSGCNLHPKGATALVVGLHSIHGLTMHRLDLSRNFIGEAGAAKLGLLLQDRKTPLIWLSVAQNKLSSNTINPILNGASASKALTHLDLSKNELSNDVSDSLGVLLVGCAKLEHLDLSGNTLRGTGNGLLPFWSSLESAAKSLTTLLLGSNSIGDSGAAAVADVFSKNKSITHLDLARNRITDQGALSLATMLETRNKTLRRLILDNNSLGLIGAQELLSASFLNVDCTLSFKGCEMWATPSANFKFDPAAFDKLYELNLRDPADQSTAQRVLALARRDPERNLFNSTLNDRNFELDETKVIELPSEGVLKMRYMRCLADFSPSRLCPDVNKMCALLENAPDASRLDLLESLCSKFFFRTKEFSQISSLFGTGQQKIDAMVLLLSHAEDTPSAHAAIAKLLGKTAYASRFARSCGSLFNLNPLNVTGSYTLDLSQKSDRLTLQRLKEVCSQQQRHRRAAGMKVDCTQYGNGEFWRNIQLDGKPYELSCNSGVVPERGFLSMDVATMLRPPANTQEISPEQFQLFLESVKSELGSSAQGRFVSWLRWASTETDFYISAQQLSLLIEAVPEHEAGLRGDIFVTLWPRVTNEEDLYIALGKLQPDEEDNVRSRIGTLSVFNPFAPDGGYRLNLAQHEDRLLGFTLLQLAVDEDGENIVEEALNGDESFASPVEWLEEGLPRPSFEPLEGIPHMIVPPEKPELVWSFEYVTPIAPNMLCRKKIAENTLGWEFDHDWDPGKVPKSKTREAKAWKEGDQFKK